MSDSTSTLTGAGYQPDGAGAQQENTLPKEGENKDTKDPTGPDKGQQDGDQGAKKEGNEQGNPLAALVQNRQKARSDGDNYQAQIETMRQEIANLKAAGAQPQAKPEVWTNPYNETDAPIDHLRAELEHTRAEMKEFKEAGTQELADTRGVQALAQFEAGVAQEISMVAQQTPEILQAYGYINQQITQMHQGQGLSGRRLSDAVRNSILQAYVNGQTNGMSHAQTTAQMALNMGFKEVGGKTKVDPVKRGEKAAGQSLGQATSGGGDTTPPSAQQLTKMSKEELKANDGAGVKRIREFLQGKIPVE